MTSVLNGDGQSNICSSTELAISPHSDVNSKSAFFGGSELDLSPSMSESLQIIGTTQDASKYLARDESLLPVSHIRPIVLQMPWFHGLISREETVKLLDGRPDGTFLIRESTNYPGDFTLCMVHKSRTEHYRIFKQKDGRLTCDNEEFFDNLTQLVSHYKRDADGLCYRLTSPILTNIYLNGRDEPDIAEKSQIFRDKGLTIRRHELVLGDTIGHGEFGDVLFGQYKERKVAVKVLKRTGGLDCLLDEASFMTRLKHNNLVELLGVVLDDTTDFYMITEFMANGNLVDFLRSRGRHQVAKRRLLQLAMDICDGMAYLETNQLVHRDLAARNVLLSEEMSAKISDFGLAVQADSRKFDSSAGKFPIKWTAPEALRYSVLSGGFPEWMGCIELNLLIANERRGRRFSSKSDMWSFGILLWEIYSFGRVPYPRIPIQDVVRHIEKGYRMEPPEGCPVEISKLMSESWQFQAGDRPDFRQMLVKLKFVISTSTSPTI